MIRSSTFFSYFQSPTIHFTKGAITMTSDTNPYEDISEDEQLIAEFDPDLVSDAILKIHGATIQRHLSRRNPVTAIKGLIGYQILAAETNSETWRRTERTLSHIRWILLANTLFLLYLVYLFAPPG
jgi:hypothetical protein